MLFTRFVTLNYATIIFVNQVSLSQLLKHIGSKIRGPNNPEPFKYLVITWWKEEDEIVTDKQRKQWNSSIVPGHIYVVYLRVSHGSSNNLGVVWDEVTRMCIEFWLKILLSKQRMRKFSSGENTHRILHSCSLIRYEFWFNSSRIIG
jgi:hypothetical protein